MTMGSTSERKHSFSESRPRYKFVQDLGRGSFGSVILAKDSETGQQVAIKQMEREYVGHYVESEILNHSKLRHPHVVGFREVFLSRHNVNIVMDYASGGSLFDYVQARKRLKESVARWFFQQLVFAVDYCHRKGVANRDIKLDNLLLQPVAGLRRPLVKICDFGYSKQDERAIALSKVGTLDYMAPEVLHNRDGYDPNAADVWSCGVVLYTMLAGRYPFAAPPADKAGGPGMAQAIMGMLKKMKARELEVPEWLGLTPACVGLLRRLLEPEPEARVTVEQIMQDPWFQVDLPPNALAMNSHYLTLDPACEQSEEQIRAVVADVRERQLR
ncbi:MAG: kinase-like domain-containing protein [Monoraphidium minutum]|nr:MAG: kinase-like domain-containing protein [Monoraphidium minutum]